jgi:hypothetical protein
MRCVRCRAAHPSAAPPGTTIRKTARGGKLSSKKVLSNVDQKWRAVSSSVIQKVNCIASDSRQLSKKVVEPFFGRIATKTAN